MAYTARAKPLEAPTKIVYELAAVLLIFFLACGLGVAGYFSFKAVTDDHGNMDKNEAVARAAIGISAYYKEKGGTPPLQLAQAREWRIGSLTGTHDVWRLDYTGNDQRVCVYAWDEYGHSGMSIVVPSCDPADHPQAK